MSNLPAPFPYPCGHPRTDENTRLSTSRTGSTTTSCRECHRLRVAQGRARNPGRRKPEDPAKYEKQAAERAARRRKWADIAAEAANGLATVALAAAFLLSPPAQARTFPGSSGITGIAAAMTGYVSGVRDGVKGEDAPGRAFGTAFQGRSASDSVIHTFDAFYRAGNSHGRWHEEEMRKVNIGYEKGEAKESYTASGGPGSASPNDGRDSGGD